MRVVHLDLRTLGEDHVVSSVVVSVRLLGLGNVNTLTFLGPVREIQHCD